MDNQEIQTWLKKKNIKVRFDDMSIMGSLIKKWGVEVVSGEQLCRFSIELKPDQKPEAGEALQIGFEMAEVVKEFKATPNGFVFWLDEMGTETIDMEDLHERCSEFNTLKNIEESLAHIFGDDLEEIKKMTEEE